MPVRSAGKNPIASLSYDASVVESETRMPGSENFLELACRVVTLRLERGYLVKIYDVSSAELTKPLRRQLRENYDVKKVRNSCGSLLLWRLFIICYSALRQRLSDSRRWRS